jgi:hypothetical protein
MRCEANETNKPMVPFCLDERSDSDHGEHLMLLDELEELDHVVPPLEVVLKPSDQSIDRSRNA